MGPPQSQPIRFFLLGAGSQASEILLSGAFKERNKVSNRDTAFAFVLRNRQKWLKDKDKKKI